MPQDSPLRAALGLALVESGHLREASSYLRQAAAARPSNGPVWMGLAEIASADGDKQRALQLMQQSLSKEWQPEEESARREAQFRYAKLLAEAGRKAEAVSQLISMIEQRGDDPVAGKKAAEMVRGLGSREQAEEAYDLLVKRYPADASVWMRLGDIRYAADKDHAALDAYQRALLADQQSKAAKDSIDRVEEVLRLDPTRRGLPVRERARRWDEVLHRVWEMASVCGLSEQADRVKPLLKQRTASLEASDKKMDAALKLWHEIDASCRKDAVLAHVMGKLKE